LTKNADLQLGYGQFKCFKDPGKLYVSAAGAGETPYSASYTPNTIMTFEGGSLEVGIGTTTPSHKLNVVGDANITGTLYTGTLSTFTW
jgi:hypothetical protein